MALIASNLVTLAGVLYFHWSLFAVLLLFWLDNVVIGLYLVARTLLARPYRIVGLGIGLGRRPLESQYRNERSGIFIYFFSAAIHGLFLIVIFGSLELRQLEISSKSLVEYLAEVLVRPEISGAVLALVASRGIDLYDACRRPQEFAKTRATDEIGATFGRVFLLHFVVIVGGGVTLWLNAPVAALVLLVLLKTAGDVLALVYRER